MDAPEEGYRHGQCDPIRPRYALCGRGVSAHATGVALSAQATCVKRTNLRMLRTRSSAIEGARLLFDTKHSLASPCVDGGHWRWLGTAAVHLCH
jgi:hypothetical protein